MYGPGVIEIEAESEYLNFNALGSPGPCPVCPRRTPGQRTRTGIPIKFCAGTGPAPPPSGVMVIGDTPSLQDNRRGGAFQGKAGMELDGLYLPKARLNRHSVYCTTAIKCVRVSEDDPRPDEVEACSRHWLPWEIERVKPRLVVLAGAGSGAVDAVLGPDGAKSGFDMDTHHGLSYTVSASNELGTGTGMRWPVVLGRYVLPVFIVHHPITGLLGGRFMSYAINDFAALAGAVAGGYVGAVDQYPNPLYGEVTTSGSVAAILDHAAVQYADVIAIDTETDGGLDGPPWCLSFSVQPGTGWVVPVECRAALDTVRDWVMDVHRPRLVELHNAVFDLDVLERRGLSGFQWHDSMHSAYVLGDLPQGLKPLAWRLAGMRMLDYQELVKVDSLQRVMSWAETVARNLEQALPVKVKGKKLVLSPIHKLWKKHVGLMRRRTVAVARWLETAETDRGRLADPWEWWAEREPDVKRLLMMLGGGKAMPPASIKYVNRDKAVWYAARDADATLRVRLVLERLKQERELSIAVDRTVNGWF